jgi:hypothetical protein
MKKIIVIGLLLIVSSCTKTSKSLGEDSMISSIFNSNEIEHLEKVLSFFEKEICYGENLNKDNALDCYESFFARMDKQEELGIFDIQIPFDNQLKLYEQIDSSTFNQLWTFSWTWRLNAPDSLKSIRFNPNGKYVDFLKTFGQENKLIGEYYTSYETAGDISPSMIMSILKMYKDYNLNDIRIRLFISIHYLTMNDQYERKEKY